MGGQAVGVERRCGRGRPAASAGGWGGGGGGAAGRGGAPSSAGGGAGPWPAPRFGPTLSARRGGGGRAGGGGGGGGAVGGGGGRVSGGWGGTAGSAGRELQVPALLAGGDLPAGRDQWCGRAFAGLQVLCRVSTGAVSGDLHVGIGW